jgi:deazaflavin-dependent oxidoreductase (nitroreductase family)
MASWAERHLVNRAVRLGTRLGRDIDGVRELEVRGRRTRKPRRVPLKVLVVDGERYVVSLYGDSGWVRNLRAHPAARLRFGRHVDDVVATELAAGEKAPITQAYLDGVSREETRRRLAAEDLPMFRLRSTARSPVG